MKNSGEVQRPGRATYLCLLRSPFVSFDNRGSVARRERMQESRNARDFSRFPPFSSAHLPSVLLPWLNYQSAALRMQPLPDARTIFTSPSAK